MLSIVDTTTTETRTRRMVFLDAVVYVGISAGTKLGVAIKISYGWIPMYCTALLITIINIAYIFFVVKDADNKGTAEHDESEEETGNFVRGIKPKTDTEIAI